jgi:hypothetical protein
MDDTRPQRGRPKGTGIDDRIWLREMERLMRIDPTLRPTSAIKALGVTDPSAIRRLRDKYGARKAATSVGQQRTQPPSDQPARQRVALQAARDPVKRQRPATPRLVSSQDLPRQANTSAKPMTDGLDVSTLAWTSLWGQAFQTVAVLSQCTAAAMLTLARTPPASAMLQQQLAFGEAFAAMLRQQTTLIARTKSH